MLLTGSDNSQMNRDKKAEMLNPCFGPSDLERKIAFTGEKTRWELKPQQQSAETVKVTKTHCLQTRGTRHLPWSNRKIHLEAAFPKSHVGQRAIQEIKSSKS